MGARPLLITVLNAGRCRVIKLVPGPDAGYFSIYGVIDQSFKAARWLPIKELANYKRPFQQIILHTGHKTLCMNDKFVRTLINPSSYA